MRSQSRAGTLVFHILRECLPSTCFLFLPAVPQAEASFLRARGLGITATVSSSPPSHLVVPPVCLGGTRKQICCLVFFLHGDIMSPCFLSPSEGLTGTEMRGNASISSQLVGLSECTIESQSCLHVYSI
jgi:hypothetical protein